MVQIKLFSERIFDDYLQRLKESITQKIKAESDNYILNCNEIEFKNHLQDSFKIEYLSLLLDQASVSEGEEMVRADHHPTFLYFVEPGKSYARSVLTFHIPFIGESSFLGMRPNPYTMWSRTVEVYNNTIKFKITVFNESSEQIDQEYQQFVKIVQEQIDRLNHQAEGFNNSLHQYIESEFDTRKQTILKRKNFLSNLSVPIKKAQNVPQTFAVPSTVRKKITPKPVVTENGFKPEPTVESTHYHEILQVIHDTGVMFERVPSTYSQKGEEDLRDHILMNLEPRFEGEVSGETFNKTGKTDILLRYQGENVFVGECKIWKGKKVFLDTISQLIGYLTWRDSKAAVIMFVKQKDISRVIKTVEDEISTHPNYLGFVNKQNDSWSNYRFHINGDENREIKLAVLLVHIPE
ncbi:hypothetical protein OCF62_18330 [Bacillus wiedmannii]|uniref:hypothetical protein n=1 Tax=Bacillus TaxID=1386 RepID=UPI0008FE152F|nr:MULTISPECIES: hypothetical protein [Bacillus]MCU5516523.1 hypothetical protein [Bacillus wiedmannii]OJD51656.1 hypothetical protein BAU22_06575 [Bacillus sp. 4048]